MKLNSPLLVSLLLLALATAPMDIRAVIKISRRRRFMKVLPDIARRLERMRQSPAAVLFRPQASNYEGHWLNGSFACVEASPPVTLQLYGT